MRQTQKSDIVGYSFSMGIDFRKPLSWITKLPSPDSVLEEQHLFEFFRTMSERQRIWINRSLLNKPQPWTEDAILRDYKFTNVYRELDRASQFAINNILMQDNSLHQKLFKLLVFRFYNKPESFTQEGGLIELPDYNEYDPNKLWLQTVAERERTGNPWHIAYMMNMAFVPKLVGEWRKPGKYKDHSYVFVVFDAIHKLIPELVEKLSTARHPLEITTLLERLPAVSNFQSHEFFIDFTYFARYCGKPIMRFDANDFTNVGPGASLGIRLIFPNLKPKEQEGAITLLRDIAKDHLTNFGYLVWDFDSGKYRVQYKYDLDLFTLHQVEMWLCEYSKYWKMSINEGRQRPKFQPKTGIKNKKY